MTPGEDSHRGFGFVDFNTKSEAKVIFLDLSPVNCKVEFANFTFFCLVPQKAFDALCHSTHLYGRRLVLEWAAPDESVEELRKRTAQQFQIAQPAAKQSRKGVFDGTITKFDDDNDEEME